jgi:hypothetical protein
MRGVVTPRGVQIHLPQAFGTRDVEAVKELGDTAAEKWTAAASRVAPLSDANRSIVVEATIASRRWINTRDRIEDAMVEVAAVGTWLWNRVGSYTSYEGL